MDVVVEIEAGRRVLGYSFKGEGRRGVGRGEADREVVECAEAMEDLREDGWPTAEEGRLGGCISIICGRTNVNDITLAVTS